MMELIKPVCWNNVPIAAFPLWRSFLEPASSSSLELPGSLSVLCCSSEQSELQQCYLIDSCWTLLRGGFSQQHVKGVFSQQEVFLSTSMYENLTNTSLEVNRQLQTVHID